MYIYVARSPYPFFHRRELGRLALLAIVNNAAGNMGIRRLFQTRLSVPLYIFPEVKCTVKVFKYCSYCWSLFPGSENWSARLKVKRQRKQTVTTLMAQKTQWVSPGSILQSSVRCVKNIYIFLIPNSETWEQGRSQPLSVFYCDPDNHVHT